MMNDETSGTNNEAFEQTLRAQNVRQIPDGWRESILRAAQNASDEDCAQMHPTAIRECPLSFQMILKLWHELILPARRYWAGLATIWVSIVILNVSLSDDSHATIATTLPPSELLMAYQQQQQLLAELNGPTGQAAVKPPKQPAPRSRSERHNDISTV